MLEKYFFLPASNKKFIYNLNKIETDKIVFDLEDAITNHDLNDSIENLSNLQIRNNYWVRFPFLNAKQSNINKLIDSGFRNFVVPKIRNKNDYQNILKKLSDIEEVNFIILVENPYFLLKLTELLSDNSKIIVGVGLGSHDYSAEMNMQHDFENLTFARNIILNTAKAYNINAVDIASMEIDNKEKLEKEFISAVRMGFDGKFFIHPKQLEIFNKTKFFTDEEIEEAIEIVTILKDKNDFAAFKYNGKVYEKPHLKRLVKIVEWVKKYETI